MQWLCVDLIRGLKTLDDMMVIWDLKIQDDTLVIWVLVGCLKTLDDNNGYLGFDCGSKTTKGLHELTET